MPVPLALPTEATAPIYLDGVQLFRLSAPALEDASAAGQPPTEVRAREIQDRLNSLVRQIPLEPGSTLPEVSVVIDEPSNLPVVFIGDQSLLTVTTLDAQFSGYATPSELAATIERRLEAAFVRYVAERSHEALKRQSQMAFTILCLAATAQFFISRFRQKVQQRQIRLVNAQSEIKRKSRDRTAAFLPIRVSADDVFETVFEQIRARLDNRQKRKINEGIRNLLWATQTVLWVGSLLWTLYLYPQSRWIATLLLAWIKVPARILLILGVAYFAVRLSSLLIEKSALALQESARWRPAQSRRVSLRFSTFSQVAKGVAGSIIFGLSGVLALSTAGIEVAPLLAGAGIAGIAVSFAAQSLVKDVINGFLILFEDQFGIGDVVETGGFTGTVESLNLRITQIRDSEGRLITIPNSQITTVQNLSMDWAQVDLSITVAHHNNLEEVLALLKAIATDLSQETDWQKLILEPPEILGVESIDYKGITLRLWIKTQPLKQWMVARELRQRIKSAFDKSGIEIGVPLEEIMVNRVSSVPVSLEEPHLD